MKATYFKVHKFLIWYIYGMSLTQTATIFSLNILVTGQVIIRHHSSMVVSKDLVSYQIEFSFTTINLVFSL